MPHEMTAVLTLLLALVSAIGMLWIALRLERAARRRPRAAPPPGE